MATHSSVLAWRIPGKVEPAGLPSLGSHRVGHDWNDLAAAAASLCKHFEYGNYWILPASVQFSSVTKSCLTLCDPMDCSMSGFPTPSTPTPRAHSNSCPLSRWCHPTISCSVVPFSTCLQSFLASGSFQMSQFFTSSGQSIGVSALASVLPMNIQDWFPLGWTGWISLQCKRLSRVFSNTSVEKHQFFGTQLSLQSNSHIHVWLLENIALIRWTFVGKVMSLLFNTLSRLVITFLSRNKCLLISLLQSPSPVILKPPKIKSVTVSIVSPSICHGVMGPDAMILVFWMLSFKPDLSLSSFTFIKRLFSSSSPLSFRAGYRFCYYKWHYQLFLSIIPHSIFCGSLRVENWESCNYILQCGWNSEYIWELFYDTATGNILSHMRKFPLVL